MNLGKMAKTFSYRMIVTLAFIFLLLEHCSFHSHSPHLPKLPLKEVKTETTAPELIKKLEPDDKKKPRKQTLKKQIDSKTVSVGDSVDVITGKVAVPSIMQRLFGRPIDYSDDSAKSIELPMKLYVNNYYAGEDLIKAKPGAVLQIERFYSELLLARLKPFVVDEEFDRLKDIFSSTQTATVEDLDALGVKTSYEIADGSVHLTVPSEWLKPSILSFGYGSNKELEANTFQAPFSGYINTKVTRSFVEEPGVPTSYEDSLNATGVFSALGISMHSGITMQDDKSRRNETAVIIPWAKGHHQVWLGDTRYNNSLAVSDYPDLTGISYFKEQTLSSEDYDLDAGGFEVKNNSKIQIFKNEVLFREFQRGPGKYGIQDVPLDIGENVVRVVILDLVTGEITERVFNDYLPVQFVPVGDWSHVITYGVRRSESLEGFEYSNSPTAYAGAVYGFSKTNSIGGSVLADETYNKLSVTDRFQTKHGAFAVTLNRSNSSGGTPGHRASLQYSRQMKDAPVRSVSISHSVDDNNYKQSASTSGGQRSSTQANLSFRPLAKIIAAAGGSHTENLTGIENSFFLSVGRNFRINRHWSLGLSGGHVWSDVRSNDSRAMLTLTYNDSFFGGRTLVRDRETLDRSETSASIRATDYSLAVNTTRDRDTGTRKNNLYAEKKFERAIVSGSYSAHNSTPGQRGSLSLESGLAFTNNTYAITRPLSAGFIIFESLADRGVEYEVGNSGGKRIGVSGGLLRSWVVPVANYSTTYFTSSFLDPQYFTLESSTATIYSSGFRTGTDSMLLSDMNTYITLTITMDSGEPLSNVQGEVVCSKPSDILSSLIFTNGVGETNFFVKRNADCYLKFDDQVTEKLDLSWPTKYRDLGEIGFKK